MSRRLGVVQLFTSWTVEFHGFFVRRVGDATWERGLSFAEDTRTTTEMTLTIFLQLHKTRGNMETQHIASYDMSQHDITRHDVTSLDTP